jgi:predicted SnoaL-like aldol condensation-catalyzing enzyme
MKQFHTLISAALATTILFAACTSGASDKETTATTEVAPTTTTSTNAADENQQKLEANKKLVSEFYQSFFGDKDSTSIDKYIGDNIIQHSPLLHDGKQALKDEMRPYYSNPHITKTKVDIKHIAAEGDKVWLMVRDVAPNGKVFARVDIFKVENGKITEHWSVEQAVPKESDNKNTMF